MNVLKMKMLSVLVFSASLVTAAGASEGPKPTEQNEFLFISAPHEFVYTNEMRLKAKLVSLELQSKLIEMELERFRMDEADLDDVEA